jgi:hypothetical protein
MLTMVLNRPPLSDLIQAPVSTSKVETTKEELEGFETIKRLLGLERPAAFEDTASYFKIHLVERNTWVFCRLYFDRKRPCVWVPLPLEQTQSFVSESFSVTIPQLHTRTLSC